MITNKKKKKGSTSKIAYVQKLYSSAENHSSTISRNSRLTKTNDVVIEENEREREGNFNTERSVLKLLSISLFYVLC